MTKVREDKTREAGDGFDGSWVAHPDLVPLCREVFDAVLGDRPNQLDRKREDVHVTAEQLLDVAATPGEVTEAGLRNDVSVGIQYLESWLRGGGAVAIFNLMEDAATAEIARSQVWQWLHNDVTLADGADRHPRAGRADHRRGAGQGPHRGARPALGRRHRAVLRDGAVRRLRRVPHPARVRADAVGSAVMAGLSGSPPGCATELGAEKVIDDRQELRTYECDGLAHYKVVPGLVVLAESTADVAAVVRACHDGRRAVRRPRLRHRAVRRGAAARRRRPDRDLPDASDPRDRPGRPAGRGRAGRDQPARHPGRRARAATTTRRTRPASRSARSAATSRRTPAARTA